jgi:hypothetical protein
MIFGSRRPQPAIFAFIHNVPNASLDRIRCVKQEIDVAKLVSRQTISPSPQGGED